MELNPLLILMLLCQLHCGKICAQDRCICVSYSDKRLISRLPDNYPSVCTVCVCLHKTCRTHMHTLTHAHSESSRAFLFLFTPSSIIHSIRQCLYMHICARSHTYTHLTLGTGGGKSRMLIINSLIFLVFCVVSMALMFSSQ